MSHDAPPTYLVKRTFKDVDDLAVEAKQWNLDFRQLDRGKFQGRILQFGAEHVHVSEARFCRSLNQKGTPPEGLRTIAIPANPNLQFEWRGKTVDGQSLMVFPRDSELASVSGPDFHVYTCSLPEELLAAVGEELQTGDIDQVCAGMEAIRVNPTAMNGLRKCLFEICHYVRSSPDTLSEAATGFNLTRKLPSRLLTTIASQNGTCPLTTSKKRHHAMRRAEAFVERHASDNIRVRDICRAADVSERTLEYAFVERFGIGPKEFLNGFRLVSARRQLKAADPGKTKVTDVANSWGFWHLGQFAADYRNRFEELPSATLRRTNLATPSQAQPWASLNRQTTSTT